MKDTILNSQLLTLAYNPVTIKYQKSISGLNGY